MIDPLAKLSDACRNVRLITGGNAGILVSFAAPSGALNPTGIRKLGDFRPIRCRISPKQCKIRL